jgi:hypothetical protein
MNNFSTKQISLISFSGLILCAFIYYYYNRLEKINEFQMANYHIVQYIDWSKSTRYNLKIGERNIAQKYFVVIKNGKLFFRFQDNTPYEGYTMPLIGTIQNDSLVIYKHGGPYDSRIYLKIPIKKERVFLKNSKMIVLSQKFKSGFTQDSINPYAKGYPYIYFQEISPDSAKVQNIYSDY